LARISIATDFSEYPAGRYPADGPFNGARFRDKVLIPAIREHEHVVVDIDGVALLPSSFWEEIWGGAIRERGLTEEALRAAVEIVTTDRDLQSFVDSAWAMVRDAELAKHTAAGS
jgi:hypothetical protein